MLKKYLKSSLKGMAFLMMLLATVEAKSQIEINSTYKARTLEETMSLYRPYVQAYKAAEQEFEDAYLKAFLELEDGNYKMSLFYLEKCSRINQKFKGNIFDQKQLNADIANVKQQMKSAQQRQENYK